LRLEVHDSLYEDPDVIALSDAQLLNSRVCENQWTEWTLYRGRHVASDAREAAIGDTQIKIKSDPVLSCVLCEVKWLNPNDSNNLQADELCKLLTRDCFDCILSLHEILLIPLPSGTATVVCRVIETRAETEEVEDEEDDDEFRGFVTASTRFYVLADAAAPNALRINLLNAESLPTKQQSADLVQVNCEEDNEIFPVRRRLLRPAVALTAVVQAGKGKYPMTNSCRVPMDCCVFDRILLYLQHVDREPNIPWKFDPTLAPELLNAATKLQISGLIDAANKVLGSFQERVRREPIRLAEIIRRNAAIDSKTKQRSDTLLVIDNMVLDVSRWLHEHPGGSTIIPEQALNVDATVMFELYHASRNSFLYLKEFYIGELAIEDRHILPPPNENLPCDTNAEPSPAFLEHLRSFTSWRLRLEDLKQPTFKSF